MTTDQHILETFGEFEIMTTDIDSTLKERGNRYGSFVGHAKIAQGIKRAMIDSPNW